VQRVGKKVAPLVPAETSGAAALLGTNAGQCATVYGHTPHTAPGWGDGEGEDQGNGDFASKM